MMMDSRIPLMGQTPDIMGNFGRGQAMAQQSREFAHTNAFRDMMQQQGPGIMSGDRNALAQLARFDAPAALGVQDTRAQMGQREQAARLAFETARRQGEAHAASMDAAQRQAAAAQIEQGLAAWTGSNQSPESWDRIMTQFGAADLVGQHGRRDEIIASVMGLQAALAAQSGPQPTTAVQTLLQRAQAAGLEPGTPEFQDFMATGGGQPSTVVNVGGETGPRTGTIPPGYMLIDDPAAPGGVRMATIAGGPVEDEAAADAARAEARQRGMALAGGTVVQDLNRALTLLDNLGGVLGRSDMVGASARSVASSVPGSAVQQLQNFIDSALSNVGLDRLQAMRESSPTGGALGQVPFAQQQRLEQVLGSVRLTDPPETIRANMQRIANIYLDIVYGTASERAELVSSGRLPAARNAEIGQFYYDLPFDEVGRRPASGAGGATPRPAATPPAPAQAQARPAAAAAAPPSAQAPPASGAPPAAFLENEFVARAAAVGDTTPEAMWSAMTEDQRRQFMGGQ